MADEKEDVVKQAIKEAQQAAEEEKAKATEEAAEEIQIGETGEEEDLEETGADTSADENSDSEKKAPEEKVSGWKAKKKEKDKAKEKIDELEDRVKRQLAEFENFRNRSEKEKTAMFDMGAKSVLEKILPVVDNFERGLTAVPDSEECKPFAEGMNMIYKQLMTELENMGVKPIEAIGTEFNPDFHNAVMQMESDEYESGFVAQELQKGYMYRDTVIRHSMVAVVQ